MSRSTPRHAKRVLDPDTSDIDALVLAAADELRGKGLPVDSSSIAGSLGVPLATIEHQWDRIRQLIDSDGGAP